MATHSSILAWRIPRTEEPGRLQSMGSQIVRHDWLDMTEETSPTCTRAPGGISRLDLKLVPSPRSKEVN